jgi:hypothetical protein
MAKYRCVGGVSERGASMRVDGTTLFPHAMALRPPAIRKLRNTWANYGSRFRAFGIHWIFFR